MVSLVDLWLPILLSGVAVFFASFIAWMILPHHKPDWKGLPNENEVLDLIRNNAIAPGQYMLHYCSDPKNFKDPEFQKRYQAGPWGSVHVWNGITPMGQNMFLTFLTQLITSVFVGYLASLSLTRGAVFTEVFQVTGAAGILGYCFAFIPNAIWFRKPPRNIVMDVLDGAAYGLITGLIFAVVWPS